MQGNVAKQAHFRLLFRLFTETGDFEGKLALHDLADDHSDIVIPTTVIGSIDEC